MENGSRLLPIENYSPISNTISNSFILKPNSTEPLETYNNLVVEDVSSYFLIKKYLLWDACSSKKDVLAFFHDFFLDFIVGSYFGEKIVR